MQKDYDIALYRIATNGAEMGRNRGKIGTSMGQGGANSAQNRGARGVRKYNESRLIADLAAFLCK